LLSPGRAEAADGVTMPIIMLAPSQPVPHNSE